MNSVTLRPQAVNTSPLSAEVLLNAKKALFIASSLPTDLVFVKVTLTYVVVAIITDDHLIIKYLIYSNLRFLHFPYLKHHH